MRIREQKWLNTTALEDIEFKLHDIYLKQLFVHITCNTETSLIFDVIMKYLPIYCLINGTQDA
jgi:hypothetical protein